MPTPTSTTQSPLFNTIVRELARAHRSGLAWQPEAFDASLGTAEAYGIQDAVAAELGWFTNGVAGWKAGGKGQMTAAPLPVVLASGSTWKPGATGDLIAEAEVGFRLGRTPASAEDVVACISTMCVTIEIVGTRMVRGLAAPAAWKTADQQMHAVLVAGAEIPFVARDWAEQRYTLTVNGNTRAQAKGTHPNGDALAPLPWLFEHAHARARPACGHHRYYGRLGDRKDSRWRRGRGGIRGNRKCRRHHQPHMSLRRPIGNGSGPPATTSVRCLLAC